MTKRSTLAQPLTVVRWVMGLSQYAKAPRDSHKAANYGTSRGNQRYITTEPVTVHVELPSGPDDIELPKGSEVCIYRPFYTNASGEPYAVRERVCVAAIFFPEGAGQVSVFTSLRSTARIFSHRPRT